MGYKSVNIADGSTNRQVDGFRSVYKGTYGWLIEPKIDANYAYTLYSWGATQDNGTINKGYHSFTCSKCHNPHASRLPKLLITNCLDTKQNTWDDLKVIAGTSGGETLSPNADNNNKSFSNLTSAQNCHRLGDPAQNGTGGGWNLVTPRPKLP